MSEEVRKEANDLVDQLNGILLRYEVHNPLLAIELAELIVKREQAVMERTYNDIMEIVRRESNAGN